MLGVRVFFNVGRPKREEGNARWVLDLKQGNQRFKNNTPNTMWRGISRQGNNDKIQSVVDPNILQAGEGSL